MRILRAACLALWFAPKPAFAYYCSEPSAPSCSSNYGAFDDQDDFESCKNEMERYQSDVEDYLGCLNRNSQSAIDEYESAVRNFNDRASSN